MEIVCFVAEETPFPPYINEILKEKDQFFSFNCTLQLGRYDIEVALLKQGFTYNRKVPTEYYPKGHARTPKSFCVMVRGKSADGDWRWISEPMYLIVRFDSRLRCDATGRMAARVLLRRAEEICLAKRKPRRQMKFVHH